LQDRILATPVLNAFSANSQKTANQGRILTTLDLYTQEDSHETRAAQGEFLTAVYDPQKQFVDCQWTIISGLLSHG
jgi:hypothetical protein